MSRLEEIKEEYKGFIEMENDENYEESLEIAMWLVDGHLHWLIKQAERAEKLQEKLDAKILLLNKGDEENRYALQEQNQRYKQALEEIVEYNTSKFPHASVSYLENIANQALAGDNS